MIRRLSVTSVLLAALALMGCSLISSRAAHAGPKLEVALQDDDVFNPVYVKPFTFDQALDKAKGLNASWIRTQVIWANSMGPGEGNRKTQPKKVHWSFTKADALVKAARLRGIHVQITLTGPAPAWATGNHKISVFRPNAKKYAQFVKVAVKHFRALKVARYSLWNEPNWIGWLAPVKEQPKLYRALYVAAYKAARSVYPKAQIMMGETSAYREPGLSTAPLVLLRGVLCLDKNYKKITKQHCAPLSANAYAVHPYDLKGHGPTYNFPGKDNVTIGTLPRITTALDKAQKSGALRVLGARKMPVYLTEFGYRLTGKHPVSDAKRAKYLVQAFNIVLKNPRIKQLLQYQFVQPPKGPHSFWQSYLISIKGVQTKTYKALLSWTKSAAARGKIAKPKKF